ncbi:Urb2/Npa2 family-domain-containing protein [Cristinia sonorae]|uniref:Urb2/Npa2 family-domain-containing protein n=1 Tax=Cristinia sonorae TaxID=1940300 RepID=A0A8K0UP87_9AGAR|nr:Urb2/Npa2 family-domain-containing protein [Cristinia sonorae]
MSSAPATSSVAQKNPHSAAATNHLATHNALEFVRALKAPTDPPVLPGPSKIDIAEAAWNNNAFYMPNKAETIVEWILTRLLKDRAKDPSVNPILDVRYWSLLENVLFAQADIQLRDKAWLVPLLNRIPIAPIAVSLVSLCSQHAVETSIDLEAKGCQCLFFLWPLAVPKFNSESLLECYGAFLVYFASLGARRRSSESLVKLSSLVVATYRSSLVNTANKKKLYTTFTQTHLRHWLECSADVLSVPEKSERYEAGIETLFNVDTLRSVQEVHAANTFEKALANLISTQPDIVLQSLPRLFRSHGQTQIKYRAALYGQGSKQTTGSTTEQARSASMGFLTLCESLLSQVPENEAVWTARVSLLRIVDQEGLLSRSDEDSAAVLRRIGESAVLSLGSAKQEDHGFVKALLSALTTLTHIDYDLVPFGLTRVLPLLVTVPSSVQHSGTYLQQLLEYHAKTRTLDIYVTASFHAFTSLSSVDNRTLYISALSGPLLHHTHLESISRSARTYFTPGQVLETAQSIIRRLKDLLEEWENVHTEGIVRPKKKRKLDSPSDSAVLTMVKFVLVARFSAAVLASLPLHFLLPDVQSAVRNTIQEALDTLSSKLRTAFKAVEKSDGDSWGWQLLIIAILSLRYALANTSDLRLSLESGDKTISKMLSCVKASHVFPELRVEILRFLLYNTDQGRCEADPVFNQVIACLYGDVAPHEATWTGRLHQLDQDGNGSCLSLAVLHLLCSRWLPMFNQLASDDHIHSFTKSILSGRYLERTSAGSGKSLTCATELQQILQDAQFWELNRLRESLLAHISAETSSWDSYDLNSILKKPSPTPKRPPAQSFNTLRTSFEVILYTPQECLSRESRNELLRRAMTADLIMKIDHDWILLVHLREFIRRTTSESGVEHPYVAPYLFHLMRSQFSSRNQQLESLTQELIRIHISAVVTAAVRQKTEDMGCLLQEFLEAAASATVEPSTAGVRYPASLMTFFNVLVNGHMASHFTEDTVQTLRQLQERLFTLLLPQVNTRGGKFNSTSGFSILSLWWSLLSLRRWLFVDTSQTPLVSTGLASQILSTGLDTVATDVYPSILAIALEELHLQLPDRQAHLDFIVAVYLSFSHTVEARTQLDSTLSKSSRRLQAQDFEHILGAVADGLGDGILSAEDLTGLIRLSGLLLQSAPEGTLKVVQKHTAQCLAIIANRPLFVVDTALTLKTLEFISRHFNERPAAIRSIDVSTLWSFLSHCLSGSTSHTNTTSTAIFQEIVSVISALVRLRRDLILPTLPLLGHALHKLVLILRTLTPNLGATQSKLVSDTLPMWVNATDAVTPEESKALARLLTTLATKSLIRTHHSVETKKADSLARPFSKHAAHVLVAYLAALNDPLCVMSSAIRKELEPGLFALCEIMGEQNRDALMVTLNAGEKAVMKGLWRAYEKQRYIGKG